MKEIEMVLNFKIETMNEKLIQKEQLIEFHPKTSFTVMSKGRVVSIVFDEISHVSKYGNDVVIYTANEEYRTCYSLQEILHDLPVNDFFRVHRSHIVSLRNMNGVKRKRIMVGEYYLPVSGYYKMQMIRRLVNILDREFLFYEENTPAAHETYL